ncbi:MAG TPA: hypothetical protein VE398_20320 [Acidobacteriota bacterium]|nr:hypothetical protein [Acidobacteriota bacterium]
MKTYTSPRELLAKIELLLTANQPAFRRSPLDEVIEVLAEGRHYSWIGIYLALDGASQQILGAGGEAGPAGVALPETRTRILVSIKLAGHELGVIAVESDRDYAFGHEDRVLLEDVANTLARFLSGPGKYLVRRAKAQAH